MNDVATTNGGAVATGGQTNFFTQYGDQASQKGSIVGSLLKFSKGDFTVGTEDIPAGTELIANMAQLLTGWIRWENNKPTDQLMGAVMEGFQPAKRNSLGDDNKDNWEVDASSQKPKDPWQFSNYLVLREKDRPGDAGLMTFATSSRGGINAMGELCKAYGKVQATKPHDWPVVALKVDSYKHDDYGKIYVPVFDIVGWVPRSTFDGAGEETQAAEIQPASSSGREPRGAGTQAPATATKF